MAIRIFSSFVIAFSFFSTINSQILLNEIQSSNTVTLKDEFNEYPDWIEVINNSTESVNLNGWYLSDEKDQLTKWSFPSIQLAPSQVVLVCASGRDLKQVPTFWNTIVDAGSNWKYLIPGDTVSQNWKNPGYSDLNWVSGASGFGYGDGDDGTILPEGTVSVYTRQVFNLTTLDNINSILLHVDYDDGFVAYLNGVEIARANLGDAGSNVTYNQLASAGQEAFLYQGQQPPVYNLTSQKNLLVVGENTLAVEVHNTDASSTDLSLITFLTFGQTSLEDNSDAPSDLLLLGNQLPHTNFKIKSGGEVVILSNPGGLVIDSITPPSMQQDFSFGRLGNNINVYNYFNTPTPGTANGNEGFGLLSDDQVKYSVPGGYHPAGFSVQLTSTVGGPIYYTTDGSDPSETSSVYSSAINISANTVLKSRVIKDGYLIGRTYAATYITERSSDLPIACLSTLPANLWDYNTGMYEMGPNAQSSYPHFGANFWMEWEKPFWVEIYNTNGSCVVNQGAGASIFGAWSRAKPQKSFAIFARKNYGENSFDYPLFKTKEIDEYKSFVLRNAGNDWELAFMRDGLITDITSHLGLEYQAFQPTTTYLNGEYWGIYNMREKVNEDFLAAQWYLDPDNITILQNDAEIVEGDNTEYIQLRNYLNNNSSLAEADKYAYVSDRIDIDNFIKYQLVQIYVDNRDWPGNNIKYWKSTDPGSKWRWILYDTDFGLGLYNSESYMDNTIDFALEPNGGGWPNPSWSTLLFRRLVTNLDFRNDFINQMLDNCHTTFDYQNIEAHVDSITALYTQEMPYHKVRWGQSYDSWLYDVQRIKDWSYERQYYMEDFLYNTFNLSGFTQISLNVSNEQYGRIRLNTITPDSYPFQGSYFKEIPLELEAIPAPGYIFTGWEGAASSTERTINFTPTENSASFTANFSVATAEDISLVINEINYNSAVEKPSGDWIEIYNNGKTTVDLSGYKLSDSNIDSAYVFSAGTHLYPGEFLVVAKNYKNFRENNPYITNVIGDFTFGLSSIEDNIRIYNPGGTIMDAVDYMAAAPWPVEANGTGITLELKGPSLDNGQVENWVAVKQFGTPGRINSMLSEISEPENENISQGMIAAFPNKFSDYTTITFTLPSSGDVKIDVIDMQGRVVSNLENGYFNLGENYTEWVPGESTTSGVYVVRIISGSYTENINVVYLK